MKSYDMFSVGWVSFVVLGILICSNFLIFDALGLVIFLLRMTSSGPYMDKYRFTSSDVMEQLRKTFFKGFKEFLVSWISNITV